METKHNEIKDSSKNEFKKFIPDRIYLDRDSLFTELFKISHFNSLLNMFFSFIILMFINTIVVDWLNKGFLQHVDHILWVQEEFSELVKVMITLLCLYLFTIFTFLLIKIWVTMRIKFRKFDFVIDVIIAMIYLLVIGCVIGLPILVVINYDIPPCSSAFIVYEQIRIFMKIHAYTRTIIPNLKKIINLTSETHQNSDDVYTIMSWNKFLYFLIIPTLIYRNDYPKRKSINYKNVLEYFTQFVLCIIFMYYIFIHLMRPIFIDFNPSYMTKEILIPKLFQAILPTILMMLTMFFCFLHLWLNGFAELTKFGDRQFYKDWWNATSLSDYFRTWNVLIHDWLYTYIYKDISYLILKITNKRKFSKSIGSISVLLFSALVHEYVLAFCFKFLYPVLLTVFFVSGTILYFVKSKRNSRIPNIMLWTGLYIGNTIFVTLYSLEWYARRNCAKRIYGYWDFFIPRSLFCEMN